MSTWCETCTFQVWWLYPKYGLSFLMVVAMEWRDLSHHWKTQIALRTLDFFFLPGTRSNAKNENEETAVVNYANYGLAFKNSMILFHWRGSLKSQKRCMGKVWYSSSVMRSQHTGSMSDFVQISSNCVLRSRGLALKILLKHSSSSR